MLALPASRPSLRPLMPRPQRAGSLHRTWGVISTISSDMGGAPFGNIASFSDGLLSHGRGIPYFYLTELDPTASNAFHIVMKLNLTTGLVPTLNVSAALLTFVFLRTWTKLLSKSGIMTKPLTCQESTVAQTCAIASYTIAYGGGYGSYLLGLNKKTYEQAGVGIEGNGAGSYRDPGIGWMTGFSFTVSFVGILILITLRKVKEVEDFMEMLTKNLQEANEETKSVTKAFAMRGIKKRMDKEMDEVAKVARAIKMKLEEIDQDNLANLKKPGCQKGIAVDRSRMSMTVTQGKLYRMNTGKLLREGFLQL